MMGIIAKYDLNHFLMMFTLYIQQNPLLVSWGAFCSLSTVKISFSDKAFRIKNFDFFALKRNQFLCFKIRK